MSKYARKMRRKAEEDEIYERVTRKILHASCCVLTKRFGRLRRKDTRIERYLDMVNKVILGEEI